MQSSSSQDWLAAGLKFGGASQGKPDLVVQYDRASSPYRSLFWNSFLPGPTLA